MYRRILVALVIVVAFMATAVAVEASEETATSIDWDEWKNDDSLWTEETTKNKGWILTKNITLTTSWNVPVGVNNLDLNGCTIKMEADNKTITVQSGAELTLYDSKGTGKITHSTHESGGKTVKYKGCGVDVSGTFTMNGGNICGNTNEGQSGGGIHNTSSGTFTMNGGTISDNVARSGGGIQSTGHLIINGGTITGNKATMDYGTSIYGGGGGIDHWAPTLSESFCISGSPDISGNTDVGDKNNNIVLDNGKDRQIITIAGKLTGAANIHITCKNADAVFTSGYSNKNPNSQPSTWFHSDNSSYGVILENNEAKLSASTVVTSYNTLVNAIAAAEGRDIFFVTIGGSFEIGASNSINIPSNVVLTIDIDYILTNKGTITNSGSIYNYGKLTNEGTLTNKSTLTNSGTIYNNGTICIQGDNGLTGGSTLTWDPTGKYYYWSNENEPTFNNAYVGLNGKITVDTSGLVILSNPTGPITIGPASSTSTAGGLAVINTGTAQNVMIQNLHTTIHGILLVNPANVTITECTIGGEGTNEQVSSWLNSDSGIYAEQDVRKDSTGTTYTYNSYIKYITDGGGIIQVANASGDISITNNTIYGASDRNATGISTTYSATGDITISENKLYGIGATGIQLGGLNTGTNEVDVSGKNTISFANYGDSDTYVGRAINISGQNTIGGSISIKDNIIKPTGSSYLSDNTYDVGGVVGLNANGGAMYGIDVSGNTIKETPITTTYNLANIASGSSVYIDCGAYVSLSSALDYTTNKLYGTLNLISGSISVDNNEVVTGLTLNSVSLRNLEGCSTISASDSALTIDNIASGRLGFASGSNVALTSVSGTVSTITSDTVTFTPASTSDAPGASMDIANQSGLGITVNSGTMRLNGTITAAGTIKLANENCSLVLGKSSSYWGSAPKLVDGTTCKGWKETDGTEHASVNYINDTGEDVTAYWNASF